MQRVFHVLLPVLASILFVSLTVSGLSLAQGEGDASLWRGIRVAPENRCSPYDRDDYPYS